MVLFQPHFFLKMKNFKKMTIVISSSELKGEEAKDSIVDTGFNQYRQDLGIQEEIAMLVIAYKLKCETVWQITRDEFINGWLIFGYFFLKFTLLKNLFLIL